MSCNQSQALQYNRFNLSTLKDSDNTYVSLSSITIHNYILFGYIQYTVVVSELDIKLLCVIIFCIEIL